jgi:hypothetical protein
MERVFTLKEELLTVVKENPVHLISTLACIRGELGSSFLELTASRTIVKVKVKFSSYNKITNYITFNKNLSDDDFEITPSTSKEKIVVNKMRNMISSIYHAPIIIGDDAQKEDRYIHKAYLDLKSGEFETVLFYEYS